jgi:acetate kinase
MSNNTVMAKGVVEKIGLHGSFLKYERLDGDKVKLDGEILDHQMGIEFILGILTSAKRGVIKKFEEIDAVGHRVVFGGEEFHESVLINDHVMQKIEEYFELAPLHNPANFKGIKAMQDMLPNTPHVVTFDSSFHQTMPDYAFMYAIPYALYKKYGIRRYGFHGTSHRYVSKRACEILGFDIKKHKIITCHLGNGASVAAIKFGKSVDTSMGLTPVEGLIMGTRSGDIDAGVLSYLMNKEQIDAQGVNSLINKHSGILGISGISSDMREISDAAYNLSNERALLALQMFYYRIRKYIGAYTAAMGGVDLIIFTGGIGENAWRAREEICKDFDFMGLSFDAEINRDVLSKELIISKPNSKIKVMIVPTNEELIIAQDTQQIVMKMQMVNQ